MESGGVFGGQLASDAATATTGVAHVPAGQAVCSELLEECYGRSLDLGTYIYFPCMHEIILSRASTCYWVKPVDRWPPASHTYPPTRPRVCSELLEECYGAITLDRAPASDIRTGDHMVLVLITA